MANMAQAIRMALHYGEEHLGLEHIFGEDVGPPLGGAFTVTQGLTKSWNSPLDERGIVGAALGLAYANVRAVAEIQFCDYIFNTIDLLKLAGMSTWSTNGDWMTPMTIMTPVGAGIRGSIYHSHSFDAWASRLAGWKVVMPSTPLDAYGLLLSCIQDPNPCLFLKPKALMRVRGDELIPGEPTDEKELKTRIDAPLGDRTHWKADWPKVQEYLVPFGKGKIVRQGQQISVISYGRHVTMCLEVAQELSSQGFDVEVIDLRSIYPYDWTMIKNSVKKTGRVLFVNEETEVTNFAEHLVYRVTQELFYDLMARPSVLAGKNVPGIGLHANLEDASVPQKHDIRERIIEICNEIP